MLNYLIAVNVATFDFNFSGKLFKDIFQFLLVYRLDRFSHQFERITVCNRLVVIISVNIITKYSP